MRTRPARLALAAAVLAAAGFGACGGGDGDDQPAAAPASADATTTGAPAGDTTTTTTASTTTTAPTTTTTAPAGGTREDLEATARTQAELYYGGGTGDTWDTLSDACQDRWTQASWATNVNKAREYMKPLLDSVGGLTITGVTIAEFTPTAAAVIIDAEGFTNDADDSGQQFVWERSGWRTTDCTPAPGVDPGG